MLTVKYQGYGSSNEESIGVGWGSLLIYQQYMLVSVHNMYVDEIESELVRLCFVGWHR